MGRDNNNTEELMSMSHVHVGLDVAKDYLDVCVHPTGD